MKTLLDVSCHRSLLCVTPIKLLAMHNSLYVWHVHPDWLMQVCQNGKKKNCILHRTLGDTVNYIYVEQGMGSSFYVATSQ